MEVFTCEQGSEEWFRARAGIPTASEFATVMATGRDGGDSKTRRTYMLKLAGEILTGEPMENYSNAHMERGKIMEDEARDLYSFTQDADLTRVGFIKNGMKGCSPDSLIDDRGMLEIKTKLPHLLIEILLKGEFPAEHRAQCQGNLWVAGREWIDIGVYWPKLPLFVKRAQRDESYIDKLELAVGAFNEELAATVESIKRFGAPTLEADEALMIAEIGKISTWLECLEWAQANKRRQEAQPIEARGRIHVAFYQKQQDLKRDERA